MARWWFVSLIRARWIIQIHETSKRFARCAACLLTATSFICSQIRINADNVTYWSHSFPIANTRCSADACNIPRKHAQAFVADESVTPVSEPTAKPSVTSSETQTQTNVSPVTTSSPSAGVLQNKPSVPTASTVFADPLNTAFRPASYGLQSSGNSAPNRLIKRGYWLDSEKTKFHLVFIVWPALVGISMSL